MILDKSAVLTVLSRHLGRESGVHIAQLVSEITGSYELDPGAERRVRTLVSELREDGVAVCAHPNKGYFIAETADELELCCEFLRSRAMHSLVIESKLRKLPLPDLLGQLRLKT